MSIFEQQITYLTKITHPPTIMTKLLTPNYNIVLSKNISSSFSKKKPKHLAQAIVHFQQYRNKMQRVNNQYSKNKISINCRKDLCY